MLSMRVAISLVVSLGLFACGGHHHMDAGSDSSLPDSGLPDSAPLDSGLPDVGAPPACDITPEVVTALPGYGDGSSPTGFAATAGHYAFTFSSPPAASDGSAVHLAVVDAMGSTLADETLEEAQISDARITDSKLASLGGSFFAVWTRANLDAMGVVTGTEIHNAVLSSDGEVLRPAATLYDSAVAPVLVADDAGGFLLRSDVQFVSGTTVITPHIAHLDLGGDPVGVDVNLLTFWQVDAKELGLALANVGPTLLSRVPPSQLYSVSFSPEGGPLRSERRVTGFAYLDSSAARDDRVLAVATERVSGEGRVTAFVLARDGSLVAQAEVGRGGDVQPRAAAVVAWPGFVVAWRQGQGDAAVLMAAGLDLEGNVRVPAQRLVAAPGAVGPLFAVADGDGLALGFRQDAADGTASLALVRSCAPR